MKILAHLKLQIQKLYFSWFNNYEKVVWLIGSGRSGTTWIANLINHDQGYREMFEPFHHGFISQMKFLKFHQYGRPNKPNNQLSAVGKSVLSGKFGHRRIDVKNDRYSYNKLLVKDIFANLFAFKLVKENPNVLPVFLIRNPFAVAHSIYEKRSWQWMVDPADFLTQPDLMEDYLDPFKALISDISRSDDYILKQILIWAIVNYVPLKQFESDQLCIVFYEDVLLSPQEEMTRIHQFIYPSDKTKVQLPETVIQAPSRVSTARDSFKTHRWKDHITSNQINAGMEILKAFGLDKLYDAAFKPNRSTLQDIMKS